MKILFQRRSLLYAIISIVFIYMWHFQLTYSTAIETKLILFMNFKWQMINILIAALPFLITAIISRKLFLSLSVSTVIIAMLSIASYYTMLFHGSPFLASDIYNITTAINVLSECSFVINSMVIRLLIAFIIEIIILSFLWICILKRKEVKLNIFAVLIGLSCDICLIWFIFFSPWTIFPKYLITWTFREPIKEYGYELCLANSAYALNHKYIVPDGYDADKLIKFIDEDNRENADRFTNCPDIILVLNETLCDLSYYSGIPEGAEALSQINNIPEIISGYTTVSQVGGGTNNSEFELLTSNSMSELSVSSPFNILNMAEINSIVSYLDRLGYYSAGMHISDTNYSRHRAYPAMGFDKILLGADNFTFNKYGNRPWLDYDNYKDMMDVYEAIKDGPIFMYLLTYQNHQGYEQNESNYDLISISEDLGNYTDDVNEYLTSITKSSEAFRLLVEYLQTSDRPVIILMVGDHAPPFISQLPAAEEIAEPEIAQKTVPYYVWSNTDIDKDVFSKNSTMVDLIPMLLSSAHMPLSVYYETILELNSVVPVRTDDGIGIDKDGNVFSLSDRNEYSDLIDTYYYMEYNNLLHGDDYMDSLFSIPQK